MPGVALHPPLLCLEAGPIVSAGRWPRPSVSVRFLARRQHLPIVTLELAA